ncbi:hypothetical protein SB2_28040 [Methylobacterium radiotolerans]|nr:hypothetical protein SB3_29515 [Methylobacterium radiotolerans]KTS43409.1 hypothetical protein SB2_28040 [Methylobacterium radiotolerans]
MTPHVAKAALAFLERAGPSVGFAEIDAATAVRIALQQIARGEVVMATRGAPEGGHQGDAASGDLGGRAAEAAMLASR